ncbi:hypothetical protein SDC9_61338 [bioreactor metagenome]|uniref:DUF2202 domain-containing protein n=1 Tax=bioreactor metagenome TaxID=1076179 RepID=A0A644XLK3_9ZZZZ
MKKWLRTAAMSTAVLMIVFTAAYAVNSGYGSSAVEENKTYNLDQMLPYAIEDEYLARARYSSDIEKFGAQRPFTNILEAENMHIMLLKPLFEKYNVAVPEDIAMQYITVPDSLLGAMKAGIEGESNNMHMYDIFLKQTLPDDVRSVFTVLRNAAEHHLHAFQRNAGRLEGSFSGRNRQ